MEFTQFYGQSSHPITVDHLSTGIFKVSHAPGHTDYTVHFTMREQGAYAVLFYKTDTYFIVHIRNFSNTLVDAQFDLSIVGNN